MATDAMSDSDPLLVDDVLARPGFFGRHGKVVAIMSVLFMALVGVAVTSTITSRAVPTHGDERSITGFGLSYALGTVATSIGSALADAGLAGPIAGELRDDELLKQLGKAAAIVYDFSDTRDGLELTKDKGEMRTFYTDDGGPIQWGIYKITKGGHSGKTIMAFRGTNPVNFEDLMEDISMVFDGMHITNAVSDATRVAESYRPDFISGHSLGGFLAECVCSHTGIPGASFAAPGPVGQISSNSIIGDKYSGVPWKTVINRMDTLATTIGGIGGSQSSHIVKSNQILWLDFGGSPLTRHSIDEYVNHL